MLHSTKTVHCNSNDVEIISGRGILRRKLTCWERAALGADLVTGLRQFRPGVAQAAGVVGVSREAIRAELKRRARAARIASQLIPAAPPSVATAWADSSEEQLTEAIRKIGPATVWDALAKVVA